MNRGKTIEIIEQNNYYSTAVKEQLSLIYKQKEEVETVIEAFRWMKYAQALNKEKKNKLAKTAYETYFKINIKSKLEKNGLHKEGIMLSNKEITRINEKVNSLTDGEYEFIECNQRTNAKYEGINFVHIPKTAGSSISEVIDRSLCMQYHHNAYLPNEDAIDGYIKSRIYLKNRQNIFIRPHNICYKKIKSTIKNIITVTVARNPQKRLESALHNLWKNHNSYSKLEKIIDQEDSFLDNAIYRAFTSEFGSLIDKNQNLDQIKRKRKVDIFIKESVEAGDIKELKKFLLSKVGDINVVIRKKSNTTIKENMLDQKTLKEYMNICRQKGFMSLDEIIYKDIESDKIAENKSSYISGLTAIVRKSGRILVVNTQELLQLLSEDKIYSLIYS